MNLHILCTMFLAVCLPGFLVLGSRGACISTAQSGFRFTIRYIQVPVLQLVFLTGEMILIG